MNISTVDQLRGDILQDAMQKLHANPGRLPEGYYSATVEPGVAMLVEPVNDDAFVFIPPRTVHSFPSEPGSGTDKLRQRMQASLFFTQIVDRLRVTAIRKAVDADQVETARRGARP
jgi:hypothetical protein